MLFSPRPCGSVQCFYVAAWIIHHTDAAVPLSTRAITDSDPSVYTVVINARLPSSCPDFLYWDQRGRKVERLSPTTARRICNANENLANEHGFWSQWH